MNKGILGVVALVGLALGVALYMASSVTGPRAPRTTMRVMEPVDDQLAGKAENSCWFKVRNRSGRSDELKRWSSVSSAGAKTERLGDLLIVTGALEPGVRDDHYYGCSLFQYTQGSPVVMTATTSPAPVRADTVIPFGFSSDGHRLQQ